MTLMRHAHQPWALHVYEVWIYICAVCVCVCVCMTLIMRASPAPPPCVTLCSRAHYQPWALVWQAIFNQGSLDPPPLNTYYVVTHSS